MKQALIITKREFNSFFKSPVAYITIMVFILINAWFFIMPFFTNGVANLVNLFKTIQLIFLAYIPVITMGLIAKEKSNGTIEILMTLPIKSLDIIIGKYFFSLAVILISLAMTSIHLFTVMYFGHLLDYGVIFSAYLGLFFMSAVYCAIGVFTSTISSNQIIAFLLSFTLSLAFFFLEYALPYLPNALLPIFQYLSITWQYSNLAKGVIDSRVIVYFLSVIGFFIYMSNLSISSKKN